MSKDCWADADERESMTAERDRLYDRLAASEKDLADSRAAFDVAMRPPGVPGKMRETFIALRKELAEARGFLEAAQSERDRWRARYGDSADALHKAATLLRWITENEEIAFSDHYDATRDEWPVNDNRATLLREWDKKMDEAKEFIGDALKAPEKIP